MSAIAVGVFCGGVGQRVLACLSRLVVVAILVAPVGQDFPRSEPPWMFCRVAVG